MHVILTNCCPKIETSNPFLQNKEFSEIIREISSHLPKPATQERNFASAAAKPQPTYLQSQPTKQPAPPQVTPVQPRKVASAQVLNKTTAVASAAQPAASNGHNVSTNGRSASSNGQSRPTNGQSSQPVVDESWLQGTTVDVARKVSYVTLLN